MKLCKSSLEKLGKAAFNALTPVEQQKYITASKVVAVISDTIKTGDFMPITSRVGSVLTEVGLQLGTEAVLSLANSIPGSKSETLSDALVKIMGYVSKAITSLIDQVKHDIANKLAVLLGIEELPGIIGAIMEFIYRKFIKPALA